MSKLRIREVKSFVQGHTVSEPHYNPLLSDSGTGVLHFLPYRITNITINNDCHLFGVNQVPEFENMISNSYTLVHNLLF